MMSHNWRTFVLGIFAGIPMWALLGRLLDFVLHGAREQQERTRSAAREQTEAAWEFQQATWAFFAAYAQEVIIRGARDAATKGFIGPVLGQKLSGCMREGERYWLLRQGDFLQDRYNLRVLGIAVHLHTKDPLLVEIAPDLLLRVGDVLWAILVRYFIVYLKPNLVLVSFADYPRPVNANCHYLSGS
jgi:hypothetical protein